MWQAKLFSAETFELWAVEVSSVTYLSSTGKWWDSALSSHITMLMIFKSFVDFHPASKLSKTEAEISLRKLLDKLFNWMLSNHLKLKAGKTVFCLSWDQKESEIICAFSVLIVEVITGLQLSWPFQVLRL